MTTRKPKDILVMATPGKREARAYTRGPGGGIDIADADGDCIVLDVAQEKMLRDWLIDRFLESTARPPTCEVSIDETG